MSTVANPLGAKGFHVIDAKAIRDIASDVLDEAGHVKVMPAAYYAETSREERALFGQRHGVYCLPTVELIDWLRAFIDGRDAIEIGAGNGVIAKALGIPATDNRMQEDPLIRMMYSTAGQPIVKYGKHVEKLAAHDAVRKYKPRVVVAAWVTHIYDEDDHAAGGNMFGVDELDLLNHCDQYVFIGNAVVHSGKPLWRHDPTLLMHEPWIHSRAFNGSLDFVAVWDRTSVNARDA